MKGVRPKTPRNLVASEIRKKADAYAKEAQARVDKFAKSTGV